jgi:hypothetical protein
MPTESKKPLILISYAHADEPEHPAEGEVRWLSFVTGYLRPAIKHGAVDLWVDRVMAGGADWEREIEKQLRACDIFILLVSPHSLSSDYVVDKEIPIIRDRQAKGDDVYFYPLILKPTPKIALDLVRDKNLRPRDGKPFSDYPIGERDQRMSEAADEIAEIAATISMRRVQTLVAEGADISDPHKIRDDSVISLLKSTTEDSKIASQVVSAASKRPTTDIQTAPDSAGYFSRVARKYFSKHKLVIVFSTLGLATISVITFILLPFLSIMSDGLSARNPENPIERNVSRGQLKLIQSKSCVPPSGDFGDDNSETRQAIRDYQATHGAAVTGQLSKDDFFGLLSSAPCEQIGLHQENPFERFFYESAPDIERLRHQLIAVVQALNPPETELLKIVQTNGFADRVSFDDQTRSIIKGLQRRYGFKESGEMSRELRDKMEEIKVAISSPAGSSEKASSAPIAWGATAGVEFVTKVKDLCKELMCDPSQLMAVMAFETGETFSPSVVNPRTGAVGLLQFLPPTATNLRTSTGELAKMDAVTQLNFVEKYLQPFRGRIGNLEDLVAALEYPAAVGKPNDYVIYRSPSANYQSAKSLDTTGSGVITKEDFASRVRATLDKGLRPPRAI